KALSRTTSWSCSCGPILMTRYSEAIFGTTVKSRLGRCLFCCSRPGCALGPALVLSGDCVGYLRRMPEYQHNSFPSPFASVLEDQDCFAECRFHFPAALPSKLLRFASGALFEARFFWSRPSWIPLKWKRRHS